MLIFFFRWSLLCLTKKCGTQLRLAQQLVGTNIRGNQIGLRIAAAMEVPCGA